MKNLLLKIFFVAAIVAAICYGTQSRAQVAADSTVGILLKRNLANYVAGIVSNPVVKTAIAGAFRTATDTNANRTVIVTQAEIVEVMQACTAVSYGVAEIPNAQLLALIKPFLSTRPWLASQIGVIQASNLSRRLRIIDLGRAETETIEKSYERQ